MNVKVKNRFFRYLELAAACFFLVPFFYTLRYYFINTGTIYYSIYLFIVAAFGFISGTFIINQEYDFIDRIYGLKIFTFTDRLLKRNPDINDHTLFAMSLFILPCLLLFNIKYSNSYILFYDIGTVAILYLLGVKASKKAFGNMLSKHKVNFGIVLFVVLLISTSYIEKITTLKNSIFIMSFPFMFLSIIIRNQDNLSTVFLERGLESSKMQRIIRNYNLYIAAGLFIIIVIAFNGKIILLFFVNVFKAVLGFLLGLLSSGEGSKEIIQESPPTTGSQFPMQFSYSLEKPFKAFLQNIFRNFVIIYACVKLLPIIFKKLGRVLEKIPELLHRLFIRRAEKIKGTYIEYVDKVDIIRSSESAIKRKTAVNLKKLRKLYMRIDNPILKVRIGYRIFLLTIRGKVKLSRGQTTGEILNMHNNSDLFGYIKELTEIYDNTVYGEKEASKSILKKLNSILTVIDNENREK